MLGQLMALVFICGCLWIAALEVAAAMAIQTARDSQTGGGRWYKFWGFWLSEVGLMFENYLNKSDRGRGLLTELLTWVWLHAGKEMCLSRKNTANSPPPTHIHTPYMFEESLEKVLIYITDLHNTFTRKRSGVEKR
ncbi:hypothetical protein C5167_016227 [Papaver somniferum]|nr:hypothetical protein C5167_016227 [Papaver somniferum]